jgi:hypothetical protein
MDDRVVMETDNPVDVINSVMARGHILVSIEHDDNGDYVLTFEPAEDDEE